MVNCNRHWPLKVKLFPDSDYSPFRSTALYDRADNRDEQRASAIADGLLSARITVKSVHNLLSLTSLHGSPFPFLPPLCELYSSLTRPIFPLRRFRSACRRAGSSRRNSEVSSKRRSVLRRMLVAFGVDWSGTPLLTLVDCSAHSPRLNPLSTLSSRPSGTVVANRQAVAPDDQASAIVHSRIVSGSPAFGSLSIWECFRQNGSVVVELGTNKCGDEECWQGSDHQWNESARWKEAERTPCRVSEAHDNSSLRCN
jgi:hypothetical protein